MHPPDPLLDVLPLAIKTEATDEESHTWPDPTGRLGDSRLWPHFIDVLCNSGTYPLNWKRGIESLSESQLLRAFSSVRRLFFQPLNVDGQWAVALEFVRTHLQTINPSASIAFGMHPRDDSAALLLLKQLSSATMPVDIIPLPPE